MPGLCVRSPDGGVQETTDGCFSLTCMLLSLSPFLPFCQERKKERETERERERGKLIQGRSGQMRRMLLRDLVRGALTIGFSKTDP